MKKITIIATIVQALQADQMSSGEAESQLTNLIPSNPMDITEYAEAWSEPKNDYDLGYRAGMQRMHEIALDLLNATVE